MTIKKEIFPTLDKKKKLNPCSLTKEKVESHLLDIALFLDILQERVEFYFGHLVLVKPSFWTVLFW